MPGACPASLPTVGLRLSFGLRTRLFNYTPARPALQDPMPARSGKSQTPNPKSQSPRGAGRSKHQTPPAVREITDPKPQIPKPARAASLNVRQLRATAADFAGPDTVLLALCSSPASQGKAGSAPAAITHGCFGRKLASLPAVGFYLTRPGAASPPPRCSARGRRKTADSSQLTADGISPHPNPLPQRATEYEPWRSWRPWRFLASRLTLVSPRPPLVMPEASRRTPDRQFAAL
jgi:hypothetical protein